MSIIKKDSNYTEPLQKLAAHKCHCSQLLTADVIPSMCRVNSAVWATLHVVPATYVDRIAPSL
jgi:hypothetical protein